MRGSTTRKSRQEAAGSGIGTFSPKIQFLGSHAQDIVDNSTRFPLELLIGRPKTAVAPEFLESPLPECFLGTELWAASGEVNVIALVDFEDDFNVCWPRAGEQEFLGLRIALKRAPDVSNFMNGNANFVFSARFSGSMAKVMTAREVARR